MGVHVCLQAVPGSEATDTPCRAWEEALSHRTPPRRGGDPRNRRNLPSPGVRGDE